MKVSKDTLDNSQVVLNVELEAPEMEHALDEAYRHLVRKASIPGFRKGKTPRSVLEAYLGKGAFLEEAIEHAVPEAYNRAVEEQKVDAIARPHIEITGTEPVRFKATVPVRPTVTLGDYRSIRIAPEPTEVTGEQVDSVIERLRKQQAVWEPADRPSQLGDLVVMDVRAESGGSVLIDRKGLEVELAGGSAFPAPGFAEKVAGLKKGEESGFSLPLRAREGEEPREAAFKVSLSEVKQARLPELDDEFARSLGQGTETLAALKERVSSSLRGQAEEQEHARVQGAFIEEALKSAQIAYPPILVENEIDSALADEARYFQQGRGGLEAYLKTMGKTEPEIREGLRPRATARVARSLVLTRIAEQEGIAVGPAEIDAEIERMLQRSPEKVEERRKFFNDPATRDSIGRAIFNRKALERLEQIARGEAPEPGETRTAEEEKQGHGAVPAE